MIFKEIPSINKQMYIKSFQSHLLNEYIKYMKRKGEEEE